LSFEATAGGQTDDAQQYLTGGATTKFDLGKNSEEEWKKLVALCVEKKHSLAYLSSHLRRNQSESVLERLGLISGHAYSVLGATEVHAFRPLRFDSSQT
jgi:hypothetical protein